MKNILAILFLALLSPVTLAETTLRVHHFLSASSTTHAQLLVPWAKSIEEASGRCMTH